MATLATAPTHPPARTLTKWLAPLASAGLLYLCFFPVAWAWLVWAAMVPVLCLVRLPGNPRWLKVAAYLGGLAFCLPAFQWFRVADPRMYVTWLALAFYIAVYWPLSIAALRLLDRRTRLPLVLTFPVVWVGFEYVRWGVFGSFYSLLTGSHQHDLPGGFSWYYLGHSQHDFLEMIQVADFVGVYGVSFLVAAANALLFEALYRRDALRRLFCGPEAKPGATPRGLLLQGLVVGTALLGTLGYGTWRLSEDTISLGPTVALLQGNVPQRVRNETIGLDREKRDQAQRKLLGHYSDLANRSTNYRPDLIVWPETSYPGLWLEVEPGSPKDESRKLAQSIMRVLDTPVLLGMTAIVAETEGGRPKMYNSAILIGRDAAWKGRYDKIHRVPFGEYTPFGSTLLRPLIPYDNDFTVQPGLQHTRFGLGAYHFGVVICYEDTDPAMARPYVAPEVPPVDFLLNISNDGWFDGTSEHDQHLAICRFRAVETRRSIGRAVNMGISAIVDSNGRVLAPTANEQGDWIVPDNAGSLPVSEWHRFKKVSAVLVGRMPIDSRGSLYAWLGDAFAVSCLGAMVLAVLATRIFRPGAVTE
jgi:apolipoprotein N-acyltransferase